MNLEIGPLTSDELEAADRIFRLAFGTRTGMSDPMRFDGDAARLKTRFNARNVSALAARVDGQLVGSNFSTRWGTYSWIGPLSVHPNLWDKGIAQRLMSATMDDKGLDTERRHVALYTVAESVKHVALYRKFGFWPGFLTLMMERPAGAVRTDSYTRYAAIPRQERTRFLDACRALADSLYPGLDLSEEILSLHDSGLGDTIILDTDGVTGFAICHCGPGSEAASHTAYIKFAAARGPSDFEQLLAACQDFAANQGMKRVLAGINTGRREAYDLMAKSGFRAVLQGVAMHRPDEAAYDRPGVFALDDLR